MPIRHSIVALIPAFVASATLALAEESQVPPVVLAPTPVEVRHEAGAPSGAMPALDPKTMQERRELDQQWRTMREAAEKDPDVLKLRTESDAAMKAWREKLDAVMAAQPGYADVKAKREEWRKERMKQMQRPPIPMTGEKPAEQPKIQLSTDGEKK